MAWGAVAVGVGTVAAGALSANAASSAADQQAATTREGLALTQGQYDQNRIDQAPWRAAGSDAVRALQYELGLGNPTNYSSPTLRAISEGTMVHNAGGLPSLNPELMGDPLYVQAWNDVAAQHRASMNSGYTTGSDQQWIAGAVASRYKQLLGEQPQQPTQTTSTAGPGFGSLTRTFTTEDLQNDPVYQASYQAGLDQGTKALSRRGSAMGAWDSGAALKALTRFGSDYTGQSAGAAFDRFNINQTNRFNRLASLAGLGQTSANATGAAGIATGQSQAGMVTAQGNANAASTIAQGNAYSGTLSSLGNYWGQQQLLKSLQNRGTTQPAATPQYDYSLNAG